MGDPNQAAHLAILLVLAALVAVIAFSTWGRRE